MTTLSDRMAKLKQESNQSPRSSSVNSSPLSLYLAIYNKASYDCYINHMQGAKDLYNWLTSYGLYPLTYEEPADFKIPHLLTSYPLNEIVKILSKCGDLNEQATMHRAIIVTLHEDI